MGHQAYQRASGHRQLREKLQRELEAGMMFVCPRCSEPIIDGMDWDLGHSDPTAKGRGEAGDAPEHRRCNRRAGRLSQLPAAASQAGGPCCMREPHRHSRIW